MKKPLKTFYIYDTIGQSVNAGPAVVVMPVFPV